MGPAVQRELAITRAGLVHLPELRGFVVDACVEAGMHADVRHALELAVDEACTNVIQHAYAGTAAGPLVVGFDADDAEVRVHVTDRGMPFPPHLAPPADIASSWTHRVPGGLGWYLIRHVVDAVRYATESDGSNRLTLIVRRNPTHKRGPLDEHRDR